MSEAMLKDNGQPQRKAQGEMPREAVRGRRMNQLYCSSACVPGGGRTKTPLPRVWWDSGGLRSHHPQPRELLTKVMGGQIQGARNLLWLCCHPDAL